MNVKNLCLAVVGFALIGLTACTSKNDKTCQNEVKPIEVAVPERPAGQQDVIQLTTPKLDTVRVGFVGLGMRGPGAVQRWTHIPGTKIVALCDVEPDRVAKANEILVKAGLPKAAEYSGSTEVYKELCDRDDIDIVYIATDWIHHAPIAIYAMEKGKHAAIEVTAATSLQECWDLINTSERTRKHCMMLENCVYDFFELTALNMAQKGLFGDILHVEGSYIHNLSDFWGDYWNNWRLDFNRKHKGDVYPTHGFGPACQLLNIHRGDRLKTLVAMESNPATGPELVKKYSNDDELLFYYDREERMLHDAKRKVEDELTKKFKEQLEANAKDVTEKTTLDMARKMKQEGVSNEIISKVTGLSFKDIENI
jgi:predicted dehydrogenase